MKEKEPIQNNEAKEGLTSQANSSNLEREGDIFMADGPNKGPEQPNPTPENPQKEESAQPGPEAGTGGQEAKPKRERKSTASPKPQPAEAQGQNLSAQEISAALAMNSLSALAQLREAGIDPSAAAKFVDEDGETKTMSSLNNLLEEAQRGAMSSRDEFTKNVRESRENLNAASSKIKDATHVERAKEEIKTFLEEIGKLEDGFSEEEKNEMQVAGISGYENIKAFLSNETEVDLEKLKKVTEYLSPLARAHYEIVEKRGPDMPLSLEDLVTLVMQRAEDEYKPGGEFALMEQVVTSEGTVERVNLANFYEWVRHQTWRVHNNNPTNEANFFTDEGMGVKTSFRTINFYEIVFTPSFFHEKKRSLIDVGRRTPDGKADMRLVEQNVENPEYESLRQQIYKESFLFMLVRNGDWMYRDNRNGEKNMMQALEAIYKTNPLTRGDFLETILSLPSMSTVVEGEASGGRNVKEKQDRNFVMGEAIRRAWGSYISIWDYNMVKQYLGEDSVFFKRDYMKYDDKGRPTGQLATGGGEEYDPTWFDENGNLSKDVINNVDKKGEKYRDYINLFLGPSRNEDQIHEIRERMAQALVQKEGISYNEAKLAEAWAYSLCNFTGVAARNDTKSVGFDQWTKQANLGDYREGQKKERRRAKFGSKYTISGLKRIALSFVEGTRDVNGRAVYEIIQGGQGSVVDIENHPIKTYQDDYAKDKDGYILFKDNQGKTVENSPKASAYEKDEKGNVVFKNREGDVVQTEGLAAEAMPKIRFDVDTQRFFIANHMSMSTEWYDFIINSHEMDFKGMIKGYNFTGRPIIDEEKLTKVKDTIRKNITYALSTWPGTDYTKTIHDWYMEQDIKDGKPVYDDQGNAVRHLEIRDWSILESMFGEEAMKFIDMEVSSDRRKVKIKEEDGREKEVPLSSLKIDVKNLAKEHDRLDEAQKKEVKLAIWTGVFTYMIAKEIQGHRDWDSNLERYGLEEITDIYNVINDGELLYDDEIKSVRADSHTTNGWLYLESFGAAFAGGGLSGLLKALRIMARDITAPQGA